MPGTSTPPKTGASPAASDSEYTHPPTIGDTIGDTIEDLGTEDQVGTAAASAQEEEWEEEVGSAGGGGFDAAAYVRSLPRQPLRLKQVSEAEARLHELLHERLYGTQKPELDPASAYAMRDVPEKDNGWKSMRVESHLQDMTFKPNIAHKSRLLASQRNAAWVYAPEDDEENEPTPFPAHDRLYHDHPSQEERNVTKRQVLEDELKKECTFRPSVSKNSRLIASNKEVEGTKAWWDILSSPKRKGVKAEEKKAVEKQTKEEKRAQNWDKMHKRPSYNYLRPQEHEAHGLPFAPTTTPWPKYLGTRRRPRSKLRSSPRRKFDTCKAASVTMDNLHEHVQDHEFHPAFHEKLVEAIYGNTRLQGSQTQPMLKPYQRPHLPGQAPYSRMHHGLPQNMKADEDPVFSDLHNMLHAMRL
eukprot:TRINITY_DN18086_c0_g1_i1.p1 TRINITY_DN18086_c0_g1~~TRINITY_DN18086_c0_g1_i1.p1  ORF type:complete len:414 (+),score=115.07 TRINITY_DN18086_c0_g1_i1:47-1288(+)